MSDTPHTLSDLQTLFTRVSELEQQIQDLQEIRVPAVIPLTQFPDWYQAATGAPQPPVTEAQLRRWVARPKHFRVDWLVRVGKSLWVDAEKWIAWMRRMGSGVRVGEGGK